MRIKDYGLDMQNDTPARDDTARDTLRIDWVNVSIFAVCFFVPLIVLFVLPLFGVAL